MVAGTKRSDPQTNEPEIELADGSWATDWASLRAHADWVSEDVHYNENAFTDQSAKTLLVDDSGHLFRITNNSHLELLRVITADGTTTDTVQPALTAFQLIPLNANGIYNVWRTGDNLVIREVGQAPTAGVALTETMTGWQRIATSDISHPLDTGFPNIVDLGFDYTTGEELQLTLRRTNDNQKETLEFSTSLPSRKGFLIVLASAGNTVDIRTDGAITGDWVIESAQLWGTGANGMFVPAASRMLTPHTLTITAPTGVVTATISEDFAFGETRVTPSANKQFVVTNDPADGVGLALLSVTKDGAVVAISDGTDNPSLTLVEIDEQVGVTYDETSIAEYSVAWGGANGGTNASSSSVFVAPDDIITLDHDGDYTFDVLPYQTTFSQENGTATGGIFYLKNSAGSTIEALTFPWKKRDSNYTNFPYEGGRQTIFRANMTAGTYRLGFTSHAGSGGGNRVSYNGYAHVIVTRSSLMSSAPLNITNASTATAGQTLQANGDGTFEFRD